MSKTLTQIKELSELCSQLYFNTETISLIDKISNHLIETYKNGNKVIFCGNGGSAAEAQHLAAELSGCFKIKRKPIQAEACHFNSSFVTAVSNDYDFTEVYSRHIEASGQKGDTLIGLSTSGRSQNIITAFKTAKSKGLSTISFTGKTGGDLNDLSDIIIRISSDNVPRIQEMHLLIGHIICEKVEFALFGK
jgi:D-sedoheptulose 7-phosphate isomerase